MAKQKIFTSNLKKARYHNKLFKKGKTKFEMTINSFSAMDIKTKKSFLGVSQNISLLESGKYRSPTALKSTNSLKAIPKQFDWNAQGLEYNYISFIDEFLTPI